MITNSSSVNAAGFFKILSSIAILPTSCSSALILIFSHSSSEIPRRCAIATEILRHTLRMAARVRILAVDRRCQTLYRSRETILDSHRPSAAGP